MRNIYLMMHQMHQDIEPLTRLVTDALTAEGMRVCPEPWLREATDHPAFCLEAGFPADAVVAVGGDGTLLRAAQVAVEKNVPLLGVNIGHIGFLVESELSRLSEVCHKLSTDDFTLEPRMMLEARLPDGTVKTALNDVVVSRGRYARLIAINASVGEELIGRYVADGLIVSTPTGSTGYSLSAGGPIVCPEVSCILLTPICPHSLQHRPVVAAADATVTVALDCAPMQTVQLDVDGQMAGTLSGHETMTIRRSEAVVRLIRLGAPGFFDRIRDKLTEWSC